jgi:hypothetical protein
VVSPPVTTLHVALFIHTCADGPGRNFCPLCGLEYWGLEGLFRSIAPCRWQLALESGFLSLGWLSYGHLPPPTPSEFRLAGVWEGGQKSVSLSSLFSSVLLASGSCDLWLCLWLFSWGFEGQFFFFFFCGTEIWMQGFTLAKQALYWLSHTTSPFCSGYFGDGVFRTLCLDWPWILILLISVSQVEAWASGAWLESQVFTEPYHLAVFSPPRVAVILWLLFFFFFEAGSCYTVQASLKLAVVLFQPPECWDYRHMPPHPPLITSWETNM